MNLNHIKLLIGLTLFPCSMVYAQNDPVYEQGEALYINPGRGGCGQCHGVSGNEPVMPLYPKIGGQSEQYLYNQMIDYKEKRRKNGLFIPMEVAMQPFNDEEIRAMAVYLAKQHTF